MTRTDLLDEILVTAAPGSTTGILTAGIERFECSLGRTGILHEKHESDGGTPAGIFPLRALRFRADRLAAPETALPATAMEADDGWCDAPDDPNYNRPVKHPYPASAEKMWREDHLYDLVVILGQNDDPVMPGAGSAIFFHLAKEMEAGLRPTEGCVALRLPDMLKVLARCGPDTLMRIETS